MKDPTQLRTRALEALDDIAGPLPSGILRDWLTGDQSSDRASELLKPYLVTGTVVSSDSSGLSRLTRTQGVIEVQSAISRMKEIVHSMGVAMGGRAPGGEWIADNTQMFFPESVPTDELVAGIVETHRRFPPGGLKAGFCLHFGTFYEISGGLYGREADLVELIAEEHTEGDETVITEAVRARLSNASQFAMTPRADLAEIAPVYRVESAPKFERTVALTRATMRYPLPFSDDLYDLLRDLSEPQRAQDALGQIRHRFQVTRTVVLIETGTGAMADPLDILESMVGSVSAGKLLNTMIGAGAEVIENARGLLLLTFEDGQKALDTTLEITREIAAGGNPVRVGIDRGPILLVPEKGGWRVLGSPVNLASKQAHELGQPGKIYMTFRATLGVKLPPPVSRYEATVSGVEMEGMIVRVPGFESNPGV
jgi:hypothetical protein